MHMNRKGCLLLWWWLFCPRESVLFWLHPDHILSYSHCFLSSFS